MPGADYEHPVQYAFIDVAAGAVEIVDATTPPNTPLSEFRRVDLSIPTGEQG
jgi:hypothetical protein